MEQVRNTHIDNRQKNVRSTFRIFAEHSDFILTVIRTKCKNEADADDVYQDLFLSLVHKPVPEAVENIRGYLYRAIIMRTYNTTRGVQRYRSFMHGYGEQRRFDTGDKHPEKALLVKEEVGRALKLIEKGCIKGSEARAITLRYMNNCSPNDVAEEMDVNVRSVTSYISVGLKRMRLLLKTREG